MFSSNLSFPSANANIIISTNTITIVTANNGIILVIMSVGYANDTAIIDNASDITTFSVLLSPLRIFVFCSIAYITRNSITNGSKTCTRNGDEKKVVTIAFYSFFRIFYIASSSDGIDSSIDSLFGSELLATNIIVPIALTNWWGIITPLAPPKNPPNSPATLILQPSILFSTMFTSSTSPKKSPVSVNTFFPKISLIFFTFNMR